MIPKPIHVQGGSPWINYAWPERSNMDTDERIIDPINPDGKDDENNKIELSRGMKTLISLFMLGEALMRKQLPEEKDQ